MSEAVIRGEGAGAGGLLPLNLSGRIPELDGLRGLAIGMVLVFHYFQQLLMVRPGSALAYLQAAARLTWTGVDLFFVLSGFLIGGILIDARNATNYFQVFYKRRFFRIVPIYAAVLLVFPFLVYAAQGTHRGGLAWLTDHRLPWYSYWSFTQNFWMAQTGNLGANALAMTWSLAVEEQFYLTLPLFVRVFTGPWLLRGVLAGIVCAPLLRIAIHALWPENWVAAFVLMPCRADALLLGVLAAILLRDSAWRQRLQSWKLPWAVAFPAFLLGLGYLTVKSPSTASPLTVTLGLTWIAFFYCSLLLYSLTQPASLVSRVLRQKWLGWLGAIAYGTYLFHQIIQGVLFGFGWNQMPGITGGYTLLTALAALLLTLVIAKLSWRYFERPLIRLGHRSGYRFAEAAGKEAQGLVYS